MKLSPVPPYALIFSATLLGSVYAQGQGNSSVVDRLVDILACAGFTKFANYTSTLNQTTTGQQVISQLSNGIYTVFAPTDEAFSNFSLCITCDPEVFASYLSYHFVRGDLSNSTNSSSSGGGVGSGGSSSISASGSSTISSSASSSASSAASSGGGGGGGGVGASGSMTMMSSTLSTASSAPIAGRFGLWDRKRRSGGPRATIASNCTSGNPAYLQSAIYPNDTLGRSLLTSSPWVTLEGGKGQVLAWTKYSQNGNASILNQYSNSSHPTVQNVTVVNSTKYDNFFINGISSVLVPPHNLTFTLSAINATAFQSIGNSTHGGGENSSAIGELDQLHGFTLFVPTNEALSNNIINNLINNQTAISTFIGGHVLNDTTVYSTILRGSTSTFTNAAGQPLNVINNATGLFVGDNNGTTAQIIGPDVLLNDGVVHVINRALFDLSENPQAASSALSSASSAATISSTETGAIGASPTSSGPAASSQSSSGSHSSSGGVGGGASSTRGGGGGGSVSATGTVS